MKWLRIPILLLTVTLTLCLTLAPAPTLTLVLTLSPKVYTICYAEITGGSADVSWRDSYIHLKLMKIQSLSVGGQLLTTNGTTSNTAKLDMIYIGMR